VPATPPLAPYAVAYDDVLAIERKYLQAPHPYRNPFQRDRDRILHARAFRRLAGKTQVFTRRFSDHIRSRLTHTLEVTQIARTMAGALGLNIDLVEALALVHDIGHPPFGHAGEQALHLQLLPYGLSFDHNLHALRMVEHFEQRYPGYRGLNLTLAVREGIIKHSRDYKLAEHPELAEYFLDQRPPLEAQLIDLADEIAYLTADLDDGMEAGLIHPRDALDNLPKLAELHGAARAIYPSASPELAMNEAVRGWLNALADDLITHTRSALERANVASLDDVRKHRSRLVAFSAPMEAARASAKAYLYRALYNNAELAGEKDEATRTISALFQRWMHEPALLPAHQQVLAEEEGLPRAIADYIAGMTDEYILQLYAQGFPQIPSS
jgi:dGTPase